jgi:dTDP-4-dehydrorhamnose 3,5-epimerase
LEGLERLMRFTRTPLDGVVLIELDRHADDRGAFARAFCAHEFAAHGLNPIVVQANLSENPRRGTLRGLHWQAAPHGEAKLVRCVRGALYDVAVDIRTTSPTRGQWFGAQLSADDGSALYVGEGFAHGFQTLADDTVAMYQVSHAYTPGAERGLRYDDPALGIDWPLPVSLLSDKDARWPLLERAAS